MGSLFRPRSCKPKSTDPAGLKTIPQRAGMEESPEHVQDQGFAPPAPRKGSTSKMLLQSETAPTAGREAKWGQAGKQD